MDGTTSELIDIAWTVVGTVADIPPAGARVIKTAGGDIAVFRTVDDQIFALRDSCPHAGGPLSQGIVHGDRVTCPLHNWVIDLASGHATGPDKGCTGNFPVRVVDGTIHLGLRVPAGGCGS